MNLISLGGLYQKQKKGKKEAAEREEKIKNLG